MSTARNKSALITGVTGQDGAYLAEFLLNKGYVVHGIKRRSSLFNTDRIDHLYQDPHELNRHFILHHGDMTDTASIARIIQQVQPDEIYNLAAQSHVAVSFEEPEYTANSDALGVLRLLEAIRITGLERKTRFYQASTSELYGLVQETPQRETTPFYPRSPYAVAKLYGYWITVNYREAYGLYACNGILFNHECITIDTPLLVRQNGIIDVVTPDELFALRRKGPNTQITSLVNVDIWDGINWVAVQHITATKRKAHEDHQLLAIQARSGVLHCTAHHQLLKSDETPICANQVKPLDTLLMAAEWPTTPAWTVATPELAELLGLLSADGYIPATGRASVQFTNNDPLLQQRVCELWSKLFLGSARITQSPSGFGPKQVTQNYLTGAGTGVTHWLREQLYTKAGYKRVPRLILNASIELQSAFLAGYYAGDGLKAGKGDSVKTNSSVFAQGLVWLYALQGRQASVYLEQRDGGCYYTLNLSARTQGNQGQHLRKPPEEVRVISESIIKDDEWVFDLETASGKFLAGVGRLIIHNSPIRGETFVTRKITRGLARIKLGLEKCLYLGNLDAKRDWGHARDYVEAMWLMLQQEKPEDFVIASGQQYSVRAFINAAAKLLELPIHWQGTGIAEQGIDATGRCIVAVDPRYFRPTEVETLLGDASKARQQLGWTPRTDFATLVEEMVAADLHAAKRDALIQDHGFTAIHHHEF